MRVGSGGELGLTVSLGVEEAGQVGVVEPHPGGARNHRFGMKGDTEPGDGQHRQVVRAVADGERRVGRNPELGGQRPQLLPLRLGGDDRRQHPAGQALPDNLQPIGNDAVKAELDGNPIGKHRKAPGDERRGGAVAAHGGDQGSRPGGHAGAGGDCDDCPGPGPGQHCDAGHEGGGEIDFAVHRAPGDRRDLIADPEHRAQLVEHLVFDDRRFEVGDEQPFAPAGRRLHQHVDRGLADRRAHDLGDHLGGGGVDEDVAGLRRRQPHRLVCRGERAADGAREAGETGVGAGGDQGDDEAHRLSSYDRSRFPDKPQDAPPVVVVAGPTASGKSALALALAEELGGTVVNADALQCYRDLAILTARPDAAALARAPHRLYGFLDGAVRGSAGGWRDLAVAEIAGAVAAGRLPIVVGGTGLYLHALRHGLAPFPDIPEPAREEAAALHRKLGGAAFRARLAELDPASAGRLHVADSQRLVRAYAVVRATGRSIDAWRGEPHPRAGYRFATILMMPPRDRLYAVCDRRMTEMVERGVLAEAAGLAARGLDRDLPVMKAVGLPELLRHIEGAATLAEATAAAQRATRRYAKRQTTWFRHQSQPDLVFEEQFSESLLRRSRQFIDEFLLTGQG